ncbi:MAG: CDP-alcohol phosphatidyltransferase family protein [Actinomycetia bacterium]|nr:CDP-alcohol phosphatidyltransferase family protein [Actinomycetes bacterium]
MATENAQAQAGPDAGEAAADRRSIQGFIDSLVDKVFLWAFPRWVRPNHLTALRFVLIPVILVLLYLDLRWWALGVFIVAICTDFIDGAMARTRDQITLLGTYTDPVADKLLIGAVLAWTGYEYLVVRIFLAFIVLELVLSAIGASILLRTGTARSSNLYGKTKMVLQSVALFMFLISGILDLEAWKTISIYLLWVALALAVVSGSKQIYDLFTKNQETV